LIDETLGEDEEWVKNLDVLKSLGNYANKPNFIRKFASVKRENKQRL
jgi:glucan phosphorylase